MTTIERKMDRPRLAADTCLAERGTGPEAVPDGIGIVHLGWGAFHRAHQPVYPECAMTANGGLRWGILGTVERSAQKIDAIRPQPGRYTVLSVGLDEAGDIIELAWIVGSVVDVAVANALAAPTTHLTTLTVAEKGCRRHPGGHLDIRLVPAADIEALAAEEAAGSADVSTAKPAVTAVGLPVLGLAARRRDGGSAMTVLSCDSGPDNGHALKSVVDEFIDVALPVEAGRPLRSWLDTSVTFPGTILDRITPAATPEVLVHATLAETVLDLEIALSAGAFMFDDAAPTLVPPAGADLGSYGEKPLHRIANPATGHTRHVSTAGTQEVPFRWGAAATCNLANGVLPEDTEQDARLVTAVVLRHVTAPASNGAGR